MFYRENDFNETPIGKIPKDWQVLKLGEVMSLEYGKGLPENSRVKGAYPVVGSNGIVGYHAEALVKGPGIVVGRKGTIGAVSWIDTDFWPIDTTYYVKTERNDIFLKWLFLELQHANLTKLHLADVVPGLKRDLAYMIRIPLPPIEEQKAIVGVLGVVDLAVARAGEVIAKTERLKKGLMQTLLTRGIGHKEYKQTPIGTIPKEWEIVKLDDVVLEAKSGFASGERDGNGILQLRMDNIETEGWINPEAGVWVPTPQNVDEYILKPNDILFNNTNSVDLIGKTAIFRGELSRCVYSNHLTRIRGNPERVIPEWILFMLIRKWQTGIFKAICHRHVHQAGINNSDLLNIKIPIPKIPEQQKIAQILSATDKKLKLERQERTRLERIKQGLMDLLLTGKIRIKVD